MRSFDNTEEDFGKACGTGGYRCNPTGTLDLKGIHLPSKLPEAWEGRDPGLPWKRMSGGVFDSKKVVALANWCALFEGGAIWCLINSAAEGKRPPAGYEYYGGFSSDPSTAFESGDLVEITGFPSVPVDIKDECAVRRRGSPARGAAQHAMPAASGRKPSPRKAFIRPSAIPARKLLAPLLTSCLLPVSSAPALTACFCTAAPDQWRRLVLGT